jgi:hypothetical protein
MPTNRFQFSDDFVLNNGNVGINSSSPQEKLDVVGVVKGQDLKVTGVSSFTTYEGFLNSNQNIIENVSISNGSESGSLSGEIIVGTGVTVTVASGATSSQGFIDSLKVYNTFTVPVGGTSDRPSKSTPGQLFFNRDFATIEFWDGDRWRQVDNTTQSGRGVWAGGYQSGISPTQTAGISYIQISTLGNSVNFGSLTTAGQDAWGCSSSTRGLFGGKFNGNAIEYITIASEGNSIDFGDMAQTSGGINYAGALSSSTRGIWAGGLTPLGTNVIQYVSISTLGNSLDFGDLTRNATPNGSGLSSPTRGLFAVSGTSSDSSLINAFTISSTGNAVEFGNLTTQNGYTNAPGFSNSTRGVWGCRGTSGVSNIIDYVTISTFGNATDFGDATSSGLGGGAVASSVRGVFCIGQNPSLSPVDQNVLNYVTIATTGNAQDFGDLTRGPGSYSRHTGPVSDSHGGLGGF